jgi:hypothetical protein
MKPIKAISRDNKPIDQPEGTYRFGRNGIQNRVLGAVINEKGLASLGELPYTPVGIIQVDTEFVIFLTDGSVSEIGTLTDEGIYTTKLNDTALSFSLDFSLDFPITGRAKRNYAGEIVVVFRDGRSKPRYLNLEKAPQSLGDLLLFAEAAVPDITISLNNSGGSMMTGSHNLFIQYEDLEGSKSKWIGEVLPIFVPDDDGFGSKGGVRTSYALNISLSNTDQNYDYINLALVSSEAGVLKARWFKKIRNTVGTISTSITGTESTIDLTPNELVVPTPTYSDIKHFADLNGELFGGNVAQEERLNFQPYANNIKLKVKAELKTVNKSLGDKANSFRSLQHQEVYAVYIGLVRKDTNVEELFHIPGDAPRTLPLKLTMGVTVNMPVNNSIKAEALAAGLSLETINNKAAFFPWDDLQVDPDIKMFHTQDTVAALVSYDSEDPGKPVYMTPGYWENEDENYPDDEAIWGDLAGQKVRHHRMPSLRYMADNMYSARTTYGLTEMDALSMEIDPTTLVFPPEIVDKVQGYRLYIAKRTVTNSTVIGQALTLHCARYSESGTAANPIHKDFALPGNYDLTLEPFSGSGNLYINPALAAGAGNLGVRLHSLDVLLNKPQVSPAFLSTQYKMRYHHNDYQHIEFSTVDPDNGVLTYGATLLRENDDFIFGIPADYTNTVRSVRSSLGSDNAMYRNYSIDKKFTGYAPQNIVSTHVYQDTSEESLYVKLNRLSLLDLLDYSNCVFSENDGHYYFRYPMFEDVLLVNIMNYTKNIYSSFVSQEVACVSETYSLTEKSGLMTGDTWISLQSFTTIGTHRVSLQIENPSRGIKQHHTYIGESVANPLMRYEDPTILGSLFYPKSGYDYAENLSRNDVIRYAYSKDYSKIASLVQRPIYDSTRRFLTEFPYRVVRFGRTLTEEREDSWRRQLALDYYESVKNRGPITNLESIGNNILIHYADGLRITESRYRITNDEGTITAALGTGTIFELEPNEIVSTNGGFAGLQHKFGAIMTPSGYVFFDVKQRQPYLFDGKNIKPIGAGMQNILRDLFSTYIVKDNPYKDGGFALGYDSLNNRILVSLELDKLPEKVKKYITFSIAIDSDYMISFFHDYHPNAYLSSRSRLLALKGKELFEINNGPYGVVEDGTVKPFSIDVAIPTGEQSGLLNSISWITEVESALEVMVPDKTFTHISVWNETMYSGRIAITPVNPLNADYAQVARDSKGRWFFNELRNKLNGTGINFIKGIMDMYEIDESKVDQNLPWFDKKFMEGNYFIIRFEYDNLDGNSISLHDISADINPSQN